MDSSRTLVQHIFATFVASKTFSLSEIENVSGTETTKIVVGT